MKALIVDDENPVRIAIKKLGNWAEHDIDSIIVASNGLEGLNILRDEEPEIVFLDICMPIMNGLEFLELAKAEYPATQFIIVSGFDDFGYAQKAIRFGACDYLLKPVDGTALNKALDIAIKKRSSALKKLTAFENEYPKSTPPLGQDNNDTLSPSRLQR